MRCSLQACGVGSVLLIAFVWLYLSVCTLEVQRDRSCYQRPLQIASTEVDAQRIRAVVRSDDGIDDDSIDDRTECDGGYAEPRNRDSENAEDTTSDDARSNEVDASDSCFNWKGQGEVGIR